MCLWAVGIAVMDHYHNEAVCSWHNARPSCGIGALTSTIELMHPPISVHSFVSYLFILTVLRPSLSFPPPPPLSPSANVTITLSVNHHIESKSVAVYDKNTQTRGHKRHEK